MDIVSSFKVGNLKVELTDVGLAIIREGDAATDDTTVELNGFEIALITEWLNTL